MRTYRLPHLVAIIFALLAALVHAQVPQLINYQGRVAVGAVNFSGLGRFKFALVNGDGSITYWSNDGTSDGGAEPTAAVSLTVTNGLYSVLLGDATLSNMTPIPASVFNYSDVRLRVWFDDSTNGSQLLTSDQRIAAVGYAMMAGKAATVIDGAITSAKIAAGAVGSAQLAVNLQTPPPGMILIPAGTFIMGNSVSSLGITDPNGFPVGDGDINDAAPVSVTVSAFYMDANLVSRSQWLSVDYWAGNNGYDFGIGTGNAPNHPVQNVTWHDVVKWCNARSEQTGKPPVYYKDAGFTQVYRTGQTNVVSANWAAKGYRLPTEAEWEKAARGGLIAQRFPWGDVISQNLANYVGDTASYSYDLGPNGNNPLWNVGTPPYTSPVGSFAANLYGLYDMAGNMYQWCWDWYGTPYAGGTDPRGPASAGSRVIRGGSASGEAGSCRSARRERVTPGTFGSSIGFRTVLSAGQP
jgi:formylglycine-generating enzyme required for sulfatase activity